jgi:hypothetical protein
MTTRAELRSSLRQRLEESVPALWDDTTLNDALSGAVRGYGMRFPREVTTDLMVAAGATRVTVAVGIDPERIVRVLDGQGRAISRLMTTDDRETAVGEGQGWRWWDGALLLRSPATAGTWRIESLGGRIVPPDDVSAVDLLAGDEEIVVLLAGATALRRRAIADGNRGHRSREMAMLGEAMRADAARSIASRRRRARGGWLG